MRLPKFYNWNAVFGWTFYQPKKWISVLTFRGRIMTIFSGQHHQIQIELNSSLFKILSGLLWCVFYMAHIICVISYELSLEVWIPDSEIQTLSKKWFHSPSAILNQNFWYANSVNTIYFWRLKLQFLISRSADSFCSLISSKPHSDKWQSVNIYVSYVNICSHLRNSDC